MLSNQCKTINDNFKCLKGNVKDLSNDVKLLEQNINKKLTFDDLKKSEEKLGSKLLYTNNVLELKNKEDVTISSIQITSGGGSSVEVDGVTIQNTTEGKIESVGSILQSGGYQKYWKGTKVEFEAIQTKDPNTLYEVLDDIVDVVTEIPTATVNDIGLVKPDGSTITIDTSGTIKATTPTIIKASNNQNGIIKYPDGRMEQWGLATSSNTGETEFTMNNSFMDTNFQVFIEPRQPGDLVHYAIPSATNKFKARIQNTNGAFMTCQFQWRAYGFYK